MSEVYLPEDSRLHRKVALKILPSEMAANQDRMPRFSPSLEGIVRRCLEKKPERGFQTASDLGFALESLSAPTSSSGSRSSLATMANTVAAPARLRLWKILAGAAMLAVVAVGVGAFLLGKGAL